MVLVLKKITEDAATCINQQERGIKGEGGGSICHQVVVNSWKAMYFFAMLNTSHSTAQFPGAFSMLTQPILLTRRKKILQTIKRT